MVERMKMSRLDRAKQFAPFDALKGLQDTMRMKEYEHDKIANGELGEEEVKEISEVLASLKKQDKVEVYFFRDGHILNLVGGSKINIQEQIITVGEFVIKFDEIQKIKKI